MTSQPLDEIRIRNQAIRGCTICDPAGYLPDGQLCHHNPQQHDSPERAAAKQRARQAVTEAQRKTTWKPAPPASDRRIQEPTPTEQEQPA